MPWVSIGEVDGVLSFVHERIHLGGPMPVILFEKEITEEQYDNIFRCLVRGDQLKTLKKW